jgi:site-specific DNA recombinase
MNSGRSKHVRCAIYTRVSTDQGLEQDFNSLDAQYDASHAYIRSQQHAGWTIVRSKYDDGGFSGGNTDRPALQRLLGDVRAGKIDIIVVYKVDRLTRSLADFAKLVELFDQNAVSFVSVTQQFIQPPRWAVSHSTSCCRLPSSSARSPPSASATRSPPQAQGSLGGWHGAAGL